MSKLFNWFGPISHDMLTLMLFTVIQPIHTIPLIQKKSMSKDQCGHYKTIRYKVWLQGYLGKNAKFFCYFLLAFERIWHPFLIQVIYLRPVSQILAGFHWICPEITFLMFCLEMIWLTSFKRQHLVPVFSIDLLYPQHFFCWLINLCWRFLTFWLLEFCHYRECLGHVCDMLWFATHYNKKLEWEC